VPYKDKAKNDACKRKWAEEHKEYKCESSRRRYRELKKVNPKAGARCSIGNACRKLAEVTDFTADEIKIWREETFESQNGRCAICGIFEKELEKRLCIDHDHNTGELRALLCNKCNVALGMLDDNPALCFQATKYLRLHKATKKVEDET